MNTQYLWFIIPLLIATLILLVMVLWEYRHERTIEALALILTAMLVSLAVTTIIMLTSEVEYIPFLYSVIMGFFLFFFLVGLFKFLCDYKNNGLSRKAVSIPVVLLVVFLATAITSWNSISILSARYQVSVVVENGTDPQEDVVLYIPLPDGYPEDFVSFGKGKHSVISTEHGRMLSLSTSTNLTLSTALKDDWNFTPLGDYRALDDEPDLTTRSGNQVYFFLQNTSRSVSVNLYFGIEHKTFIGSGKFYHMSTGRPFYAALDSSVETSPRFWFTDGPKIQLSPGWNEIELIRGEYSYQLSPLNRF